MLTRIVIASETKQSLRIGRLLSFLFCLILSLRGISINECHVERSRDTWNMMGFITLPGDSLKTKYDINDPRNPHCPCHQYQKLADEEFARLQNKEKNNGNVSVNGESGNQNVNSGKQNSSRGNFWFFHKRKRFSGSSQKGRGHRASKARVSDKLSRCFHF
jgi:hypothetical protein